MSTITPSTLSGIGVFLPVEADLTASTLGQEGPRAGYPEVVEDVLSRRSALALTASGAQASTTTYEIAIQRAGHVGGATVRARRTVSGTVDDGWLGADENNVLIGAAFPGWSAGVTDVAEPHAITLPEDEQVIVYRQTEVGARSVQSRVWDPDTETYATAADVVDGLVTGHEPSPALLLLPDPDGGANPIILCAYWNANTSTNEAQIDVRYSRDKGATWGIWAEGVLPEAITIVSGSPYYTLRRLRWAMLGFQIVLFAHVTSSASVSSQVEHVYHYASADYGRSFTHVSTLRGYGYPDVVAWGPVCYLIVVQASDEAVYLYTIRSGYVDYTPQTGYDVFQETGYAVTSGSPAAFSFASFGMVARPDGKLLICGLRNVTNGYYGHSVTYDVVKKTSTRLNLYGVSVQSMWWNDGNATATEYPTGIAVSWYRGQVRMYCTMVSGTATWDDRLTRLDLGGPSTVTLPDIVTASNRYPAAWTQTMLPTALASAYGATFTGAGTRSISTNPGWETLTTSANTAYYTQAPTSTASQQIWRLWRVKVDSGGGVSSRVVACGIRAAGVGYGFEVEARFSTTQIRLRDVNAAADLTTITIDTSTTGVDLLMAVSGAGVASCWARVYSGAQRVWTPIEEGYQLTDDAGAGGTANVVMWGGRASGTQTSRWILLGGTEGAYLIGADLAAPPVNPDDLRGIPLAREGASLGDGVTLGATGGPGIVGDQWTVRPDADYPVRHLIPVGDEDSTRDVIGGRRTSSTEAASGWRASATSGYVQVRFPGLQNRTFPALLGFQVEGCNAPDPVVRGYSYDAAAYTTLGTASNTRTGIRFLRPSASSPTVRIDTSGTSSTEVYVRSGALRGNYFRFSAGGKVRPILDNTEGRVSNDGDAALPILTLGGIDGTEPASGTNGTIIYSRFTFLVAMTAGAEYGAFALQWSSPPDTYEGKPRATIFAPFIVEPLLHAENWGAQLRYEDPAEVIETAGGLRRARLRMPGPRRIWSVPLSAIWSQRPLLDPTNSSAMNRAYKAYSNASYPIAGAFGDEFGKTRGAWLAAYGSRHPLVWLPRIDTSSATQTLIGEDAGLYCRVTSPPQYTDEYGSDTGAAWAHVWAGDVWTFEEER